MVVIEGFRVFTYNTMTGKIWATVPALSPSWSMKLGAPGSLSCAIPIKAEELYGLDMRRGTEENRMSLGISYGRTILEAGPILERSNDSSPDLLEISAEGLSSIFGVRKLLPAWAQLPGATNIQSATLTVPQSGGATLQGLIRELVRLGMVNPPFGAGSLPIVLPPLQSGPHTRTYNGFDLKWILDVMEDISGEDGGPDFRLRPRFKENDPTYVEHVLELGNPYLRQNGPNWKWDGTVPETGVVGFGAVSDGRKMAARTWRPGQGQEKDMLLGVATNQGQVAQGFPWMERDDASKQEDDQATLDRMATQDLSDAAAPKQQFSMIVDAGTSPSLGQYMPGDWADVKVPDGHPIIPAGKITVRIMGIDGDKSTKVRITVAPIVSKQTGSPNPASITIGTDETPLAPYPAEQQFPSFNLFPLEETEVV